MARMREWRQHLFHGEVGLPHCASASYLTIRTMPPFFSSENRILPTHARVPSFRKKSHFRPRRPSILPVLVPYAAHFKSGACGKVWTWRNPACLAVVRILQGGMSLSVTL